MGLEVPWMRRPNVSGQITPYIKDFATDRALMSLYMVMSFLGMTFQQASPSERQSTIITRKSVRLRVDSRTVAIEIWFLMEGMVAEITDIGLFLSTVAEPDCACLCIAHENKESEIVFPTVDAVELQEDVIRISGELGCPLFQTIQLTCL